MSCPGRVQIDHKESVTNSPIIVKCDFYRPLCFFAVYLCYCSSVCLSVSYSVCLPEAACVTTSHSYLHVKEIFFSKIEVFLSANMHDLNNYQKDLKKISKHPF